MSRVSGASFGKELATLLGVDIEGQYVYRIEVDCPVTGVVTVKVHRHADVPGGTKLARKYFLMDSGEDEEVVGATQPIDAPDGEIDDVTSFRHDTQTYRKRIPPVRPGQVDPLLSGSTDTRGTT